MGELRRGSRHAIAIAASALPVVLKDVPKDVPKDVTKGVTITSTPEMDTLILKLRNHTKLLNLL